jgi:hypothetical protein
MKSMGIWLGGKKLASRTGCLAIAAKDTPPSMSIVARVNLNRMDNNDNDGVNANLI